jgi:type I restriction enzyme S subunit
LWYQLQSYEFYNKATEIATGTAQLTVPIKGLRKLTIKTTSDEEQAEVVNTLDSLLFAEQQAQSAVETVLADIDTLKKSILARAFRGELSTNDPGEENAVEMLKKML